MNGLCNLLSGSMSLGWIMFEFSDRSVDRSNSGVQWFDIFNDICKCFSLIDISILGRTAALKSVKAAVRVEKLSFIEWLLFAEHVDERQR